MTDIKPYEGPIALIADGTDDAQETLAENLAGGDKGFRLSDLARVVWPGAGDDRFFVKSKTGERRAEEFVGIVLGQVAPRKFYIASYQAGGDDYPDCSSTDGEVGLVADSWADAADAETGRVAHYTPDGTLIEFGGACGSCPMSEWGSAMKIKPERQSRAQACSERRHLLFQPVGARLPVIIDAPPTALQGWRAFGMEMYDAGLRLSRTVVRLTLAAKSGEVSQLRPEVVGTISSEQTERLRALMPSMRQQPQLAAPEFTPEQDAREQELIGDKIPF